MKTQTNKFHAQAKSLLKSEETIRVRNAANRIHKDPRCQQRLVSNDKWQNAF